MFKVTGSRRQGIGQTRYDKGVLGWFRDSYSRLHWVSI